MRSFLGLLLWQREMLAQTVPPVRYPGHGKVAVVMTGNLRMLADNFCKDGRSGARDSAHEDGFDDRLAAQFARQRGRFQVSQCLPEARGSGDQFARQMEPGRYMGVYV